VAVSQPEAQSSLGVTQRPFTQVDCFLPEHLVALGVHSRHLPLAQAPEAQSVGALQELPKPQGGQLPPQSTSVSPPFFCLSVQVPAGAWSAAASGGRAGIHLLGRAFLR
jgi:hypothetical protein